MNDVMNNSIIVKMGEMAIVKDPEFKKNLILKTTLGSCVGIILEDRKNGISGLSHIMLPRRFRDDPAIGKYADTAIPALIRHMERKGADVKNMKAYVIGGAAMFGSSSSISNIGEKNYRAVKEILKKYNIPIVLEDVGGNNGRTVIYNHNTGEVNIRVLSGLQKAVKKAEKTKELQGVKV